MKLKRVAFLSLMIGAFISEAIGFILVAMGMLTMDVVLILSLLFLIAGLVFLTVTDIDDISNNAPNQTQLSASFNNFETGKVRYKIKFPEEELIDELKRRIKKK